MTLLFIDTETGGLIDDVSILQISLFACRFGKKKIHTVDELTFYCRPDNSVYKVDPDALEVNQIDLLFHKKNSYTYLESEKLILDFLKKINEGETSKPTLAGQGILYDLDHLSNQKIISKETWRRYTDVRTLDLLSIGRFLQFSGLIPETQSLSLSKIATHLGVSVDESRLHTADYDNYLAAEVLFEYRDLVNKSLIQTLELI